ncbi:ABC transporter permease [Streptococcus entericus]|uniref:ABC transporter permease n=1 Tax=Streptococcus entericus TaxID=155680 RepID=UPI00035FE2A9|nr:ABC transporter permease [Streptococcus entericus]
MRTLAITKKVIKELLRDKRTLVLMFVAPIFIMWLMNTMFSASSTTNVTLATVDVSESLVSTMEDMDHVKVKEYHSEKKATEALENQKVDGVIVAVDAQNYSVTYANTDASKTTITKQAFQAALSSSAVEQLKIAIGTIVKANPKLAQSMPEDRGKVTIIEHYNYGNEDTGFFSKMLPILMGFIVFFFVFLISGMALLKERTTGTLDRLLATPVRRSEIVFGYMLSYGLLATVQTLVIVFSTIWLMNLEVVGNIANVVLVNFVMALVALAFGILMSTLAKSEFQMMQFIPLIIMPQLFFSGIIPLDSMADWVQYIGKVLPLSYAGDALTRVILYGQGINHIAFDILILLVFLAILTVANIIGLKRYRKV